MDVKKILLCADISKNYEVFYNLKKRNFEGSEYTDVVGILNFLSANTTICPLIRDMHGYIKIQLDKEKTQFTLI